MGCASSAPATSEDLATEKAPRKAGKGAGAAAAAGGGKKKLQKPKPWKHPEPITREQLARMREEFWDTQPHYGGQREIWDALKAATEAETGMAGAIVESAGIILEGNTLAVCYDERGAKYELPPYVLSDPQNLKK